jgi:hypothetical protein
MGAFGDRGVRRAVSGDGEFCHGRMLWRERRVCHVIPGTEGQSSLREWKRHPLVSSLMRPASHTGMRTTFNRINQPHEGRCRVSCNLLSAFKPDH